MRRDAVDDLCYVCDGTWNYSKERIYGRVDVFTIHDNQGRNTCWTKSDKTWYVEGFNVDIPLEAPDVWVAQK